MVNKVINDFDVLPPSFGDHFIAQVGSLPTNTTYRGTTESLNRLFLGENIIPVYQESDIGVAVSGELQLESNKTYWIMAPIVTANTWIISDTTHVLDPSYTQNAITFVGPIAFKSPELILVRISNIRINGGGATQLFDFTSTVGGSLSMDRCLIAGFASLGNINGCSTAWQRISMFSFGGGLTLDGGSLLAIDYTAAETAAVTTCFDIRGTWTGPLSLSQLTLAAGVGGYALDIDSAISMPVMRLRDIGFPGTVFDPTGLDGTEINIQATGLDGVKNSQVVGSMSMDNNGTVTTINTLNVYESIEGVSVAGTQNERVTHSGNILTYIGIESTTASVHAIMAGTAASSTAIYEFGLFQNGVEVPGAHMSNELSSRITPTPLQFPLTISTGDTIEIKVRNTENIVNVLIIDMVLTIEA